MNANLNPLNSLNSLNSVDLSHDVDMERRFGGLARLYGVEGAARIRRAHVVVVGLGGVGSWAAEAVARSGIARLTLIDLDHIAESNINRQVHALDNTLGQAKVQAMRERIASIHLNCQVNCIEEFVDEANWPDLLSLGDELHHQPLAVIDACDQVRAKTAMAAWAMKNKLIFVSVGAAGGKRLAHCAEMNDLAQVTHDPLLARMRHHLRKVHGAARQGKMGIACVFSREPVLAPTAVCLGQGQKQDSLPMQEQQAVQTDGSLNCHGYGSVVSVTATFGFCAAGWVLDKISA